MRRKLRGIEDRLHQTVTTHRALAASFDHVLLPVNFLSAPNEPSFINCNTEYGGKEHSARCAIGSQRIIKEKTERKIVAKRKALDQLRWGLSFDRSGSVLLFHRATL